MTFSDRLLTINNLPSAILERTMNDLPNFPRVFGWAIAWMVFAGGLPVGHAPSRSAGTAAAATPGADGSPADDAASWQAGAASVDITPKELMWMAGYAARKKPADGYAQNLYAKALALRSADGGRMVFVTTDLIGVLRSVRDAVEGRVAERFGLSPHEILLNASHTHCGPEYRERPGREAEARRYQAFLEDQIVEAVGEALRRLGPAELRWGEATAGFAANRRGTPGGRRGPILGGPVDHAVPVLRVDSPDGNLRAVMFGYACHNTTLSSVADIDGEPRYEFNGDYAGYAQEFLEQAHPDAVALFMNGCGGDQNPHPRRDMVPGVEPLEMARHHGRTLALAVEAALNAPLRDVEGPLRSHFADIELLRTSDPTGPYPYPVQVVGFGDDLTLVALASEVVVDYSLRIKRELDGDSSVDATAPAVWVAGYSNGYFGYVPSARVADEGGYEAGPWDRSTEERIIANVIRFDRQLRAAP